MSKLNVCLLNDSFPPVIDGVANTVVNYGNILKADGLADPFVVTPYFPDADDSKFDYDVLRYRSLDIGNLVSGYRAGMPFSGTLLMDVLNKKPDIIHTHCPVVSTMIARELRGKTDAPIIFTYHTKFDVDIAKAVKSKHLQQDAAKFLVRNISACDEVWVVSEGAGENLKSLGYQGDVVVMNNGVDFPKGKADQSLVDAVSKEYGLEGDVPVLLFVGRLLWYKGVRIILDALSELQKTQDFRMLFIGKGVDEDEMKAYAKEKNVDQKCIFTGPIYDREKLRALNTRGDLFLFPSTYDTNGLVVREAAACGLASVVIEGSCAAEGITDGRNGFFCEENAASMCAKLKAILPDLSYVHQVGDCAMEEIYISWQDSVHHAFERYQLVIEHKKAGLVQPEREGFSDDVYRISTESLLALKRARLHSVEEFMGVKDGIQTAYGKVGGGIMTAYDKVEAAYDKVGDGIQTAYDKMGDGLATAYDKVEDKISEMYHKMNEYLSTDKDGEKKDNYWNQDRYL